MEFKKCLNCQTPNDVENNFCTKCGKPLYNTCTYMRCENSLQNKTLSDEAAYCPKCGNETTFKQYGIVSAYNEIKTEDLPF